MAKKKIVTLDPLVNIGIGDLNLSGLTINDTISLIKQVIEFDSTYKILDRVIVEEALLHANNPALDYFSELDIYELMNQSYFLGFITEEQKLLIIENYLTFNNYITLDNYKKLLQYQLEYIPVIKRYIPTISDLQINGLDDHTIEVIDTEFQSIVGSNNNINIIHTLVDNFLFIKYSSTTFTSTVKIEYVYQYPNDFLKILSTDELSRLLDRVEYYLDFLTPALINTLKTLPNSTSVHDLLALISINEIKEIMDKEVDLKNGVINALSLKEVQRMFDEIQLTYELSDSHARIIVYGAIQFAELNKSTDYFI